MTKSSKNIIYLISVLLTIVSYFIISVLLLEIEYARIKLAFVSFDYLLIIWVLISVLLFIIIRRLRKLIFPKFNYLIIFEILIVLVSTILTIVYARSKYYYNSEIMGNFGFLLMVSIGYLIWTLSKYEGKLFNRSRNN